jgi:hypothetical protein
MFNQVEVSDNTARRAAVSVGLVARKCRDPKDYQENRGGFTVIDSNECVVAGDGYSLSAAQVVEFCKTRD